MGLQFDINNEVEDFTFILSTRGYEYYGQLRNIKPDSVHVVKNMNGADELSFEVYKTLDDSDEPLWDDITDLKLVWVKELNEYFEISVSLDDAFEPVKFITGTSLCEAELGQTILYGIEINTVDDIAREDYDADNPTTFYNEDDNKISLLHRVLDKAPHYSIKYVDKSLWDIQRSFSIDGTSIYDFLTGECSEQFHCLFTFDTTDRSISAYDLYSVCKDCGHRAEFNDVCPECGSTNIKYYGEDTTIYVNKENLTESVKLETDVGGIKNCFKLEAGDDDMTAAIRIINPNGTDYLYHISDWQKADMPEDLVDKIQTYDDLVASYTEEYEQLVEDMYNKIDDILYYKSSMMPSVETVEDFDKIENPREGIIYLYKDEVYVYDGTDFIKQNEYADFYTNLIPHKDVITAKTEADKLTVANLSPVALPNVTKSTSKATVENALKNYAKVYVKTGYVKLEINQSEFTYIGAGTDGWDHGQWTGNFKVTNYSNEEDVVYSEVITVDVYDNYEDFLRQKVKKSIANDDDDEGSVFAVLSIEDLDEFKNALQLYSLNRLTSFYDAIQGALDALMQVQQANEDAELYEILYEPYYNKLEACKAEIDIRQACITTLENEYDTLASRMTDIQKILNFEDYLGEDLYKIFCTYRREDKYSNSNYISDGLDNAKIFDNARKFIEAAKKEVFKAATPQHTISTTLHNLLIMPEFQVIVDKFELGNWIRICVDGVIYRLRLIKYEISFSEIQTLNVDFSDLTVQIDCVSDLKSIKDSVTSMDSNFSYVSMQADKGNDAQNTLVDFMQNGLDSSLIQINNNTHEEITYGKHGLIAKSYNDFIDEYDPEQLRITHNILAYTDDNWKTVKSALGKHDYYRFDDNGKLNLRTGYGLTADFVTSGTVYGSQMISGDIYSENYSPATSTMHSIGCHIDLNNGEFTFADGALTYTKEDGIHIDGDGTFTGTINAKNGEIGGWLIDGKTLTGGNLILNSEGSISLNNNFVVDKNGKVNIGNGKFVWDGSTLNITGQVNITNGGKIGNFNVVQTNDYSAIYSGTSSMTSKTVGVYLGTNGIRQYKSDTAYTNIQDGILKCAGADISGKITATDGSLKGLTITGSLLLNGGYLTTSSSRTSYNQAVTGMTFDKNGIGGYASSSAYWNMSSAGVLKAAGADIQGTITATAGTIGSWSIYAATDTYGGNILASAFKNGTAYYGIGLDSRSNMFDMSLNNKNGGRVFAIGQLGSDGASSDSAAVNGTWENASLQVYANGKLHTSNLDATGGKIGGWHISENLLWNGTCFIAPDGTFGFQNGENSYCEFNIAPSSDTQFASYFVLGSDTLINFGGVKLSSGQLARLLELI